MNKTGIIFFFKYIKLSTFLIYLKFKALKEYFFLVGHYGLLKTARVISATVTSPVALCWAF